MDSEICVISFVNLTYISIIFKRVYFDLFIITLCWNILMYTCVHIKSKIFDENVPPPVPSAPIR